MYEPDPDIRKMYLITCGRPAISRLRLHQVDFGLSGANTREFRACMAEAVRPVVNVYIAQDCSRWHRLVKTAMLCKGTTFNDDDHDDDGNDSRHTETDR